MRDLPVDAHPLKYALTQFPHAKKETKNEWKNICGTILVGTDTFRAWNDLSDRHGYDLVRVRVDRMHHRASEINAALEELEERYWETGSVTHVTDDGREEPTRNPGCSSDSGSTSRGYGPDAPF